MRKITGLILSAVMVFAIFAFAGCKKDELTYENTFNALNYEEGVAFNITGSIASTTVRTYKDETEPKNSSSNSQVNMSVRIRNDETSPLFVVNDNIENEETVEDDEELLASLKYVDAEMQIIENIFSMCVVKSNVETDGGYQVKLNVTQTIKDYGDKFKTSYETATAGNGTFKEFCTAFGMADFVGGLLNGIDAATLKEMADMTEMKFGIVTLSLEPTAGEKASDYVMRNLATYDETVITELLDAPTDDDLDDLPIIEFTLDLDGKRQMKSLTVYTKFSINFNLRNYSSLITFESNLIIAVGTFEE